MAFFRIILLISVLIQAINAAEVLAVLEILPKSNVDDISIDEMQHLTDELRKQATIALPRDFSVLTRDNIIELLPPDEEEADCLAESCAIDIGRAIGVEYITSGSIGKFSGEYSLSIELYETMRGKLLGSIVMESTDIKGLLVVIREQALGLFGKMIPPAVVPLSGLKNEQNVQVTDSLIPSPQSLIPEVQKSSVPKYIAISLDVLGAASLGLGIYKMVQRNKFHKEYKNMEFYLDPQEYRDAYNKVEDSRKIRDAGFIVGGVLLSSGIMVHILF